MTMVNATPTVEEALECMIGDVSRLLNCSPQYVRVLEANGRLSARRISGKRVFKLAEVWRLKAELEAQRRRESSIERRIDR